MKQLDLTGQVFGELTAIKRIPSTKGGRKTSDWLCRCSCGNTTTVWIGNLRNGHTTSCGNCTRYEVEGETVTGIVRGGRTFIFDADDMPLIMQYSWSVSKDGYPRGSRVKNGKDEVVRLHRLVMGNPEGYVVDHINGDTSDCRKQNLRIATQHQNTQNSALPKSSTTGYKGVCFDKKEGKYMAHIHPNGRMKFLGYYDDPIEAALAYDRAAFLYFGEYARPNFPQS